MVILQSTGGSLHINNCSLGQVEENMLQNDGKVLEHDGGGVVARCGDGRPFKSDGGGVLAEGADDSRPLESGSSVLAESVDNSRPLESGGSVLAEGVDNSRPSLMAAVYWLKASMTVYA
ncbi:hypothetical protein OS493_033196 [Desmophyllum pertusum]|uniref:Uncharacterized protein n=1 Tax=Desmophyllum pertusum TaxID=174260 RepID=A0A9W9Y9J7_9CNID|nr:hypothetical protein OS493_033196 [Desmophyllum pertusum]